MDKDSKDHQTEADCSSEKELIHRRGFLLGMKKWSKIVIGGALLGSAVLNPGMEREAEAAAWANRAGGGAAVSRGGSAAVVHGGGGGAAWANRAGGGGAAWANRGAAWANRGASWINRF